MSFYINVYVYLFQNDKETVEMSLAKNTAGVLGKFGSTSFTSLTANIELVSDKKLPPKHPKYEKTSKFFKSRNLKDVENVIEEEIEEDPTNTVEETASYDVEENDALEQPDREFQETESVKRDFAEISERFFSADDSTRSGDFPSPGEVSTNTNMENSLSFNSLDRTDRWVVVNFHHLISFFNHPNCTRALNQEEKNFLFLAIFNDSTPSPVPQSRTKFSSVSWTSP